MAGFEDQDHFLWSFRTALFSGSILPASRQNFFRQKPKRIKKIFPVRPVPAKKYFHHRKDSHENPHPTSLNIPLIPSDSKSSHDPSPTENPGRRNPEKFGSGNGVHARKDFASESSFPENTRFNREKTSLLAARQNAQKKDKFSSMAGDCPCRMTAIAREKTGFLQGRKTDLFFPGKRSDLLTGACRLVTERIMVLMIHSADIIYLLSSTLTTASSQSGHSSEPPVPRQLTMGPVQTRFRANLTCMLRNPYRCGSDHDRCQQGTRHYPDRRTRARRYR